MKTKKIYILLNIFTLGIAIAISAPAEPQTGTDPFLKLLDQGLSQSFAVKNQEYKFEQAQITTTNAWAELLPTVSLSAGESKTSAESISTSLDALSKSTTTQRSAYLTANWKLWDNYQSIRNITLANLAKSNAKIEFNFQKEDYTLQLFEAYMAYQVSLYSRDTLTNYMEQAKWSHDQSQLLVRVGARTPLEATDSEIDYLNAQRELLEYDSNLKSTSQKLATLLSCGERCPPLETINLENYQPYFVRKYLNLDKDFVPAKIDVLTENNPWVKRYRLDLESSFESLRQEKLNYWPQTSISYSHSLDLSKQVEDSPANGYRPALNSDTVSLNLSWTLWDWWSTPRRIHSSELSYKMTKNQVTESIHQVRNDLELLLDQMKISKQSLDISKVALEKSNKQIEFSKQLFKLGRITLIDMQQAMSRLLNARNGYIQRLKDHYLTIGRLLIASGNSILP